jgi:hypothetical protein
VPRLAGIPAPILGLGGTTGGRGLSGECIKMAGTPSQLTASSELLQMDTSIL